MRSEVPGARVCNVANVPVRRIGFGIFGLLLAGLVLPAAEARPPITALCGARVIDGRGRIYDNAVVLIDGQNIARVGLASQVSIPPGATVVNYQGKTIMPGIVSDHSHVGQVDGVTTGPACYNRENIVRQLKQYEAYGVTTVMALGLNNPDVFQQLRRRERRELPAGAELFGADRGLGVPGGAPPVPDGPDELDRPATPTEARLDVDAAAHRKAFMVKLWLDNFGGTLPVKMSPAISQAIIQEAHRHHLRVAGHIFNQADARRLIGEGIDILAHGVRDQALDPALIQALKQRGTWCIPTLSLDESFYIYAEHPDWMNRPFFRNAVPPALQAQFDDPAWRSKTLQDPKLDVHRRALAVNQQNLVKLVQNGVRVGFGTDSGANPLRIPGFAEHRELFLIRQAGLTPMQAIELATSEAATLLSLEDRGAIVAGMLADVVVLDADPLVDISNADRIAAVWHRGQRVSGPIDQYKGQ